MNSDEGMLISQTKYDNVYFIMGANLDDCIDSGGEPMEMGDSIVSNDLSAVLDFTALLMENIWGICYRVYSKFVS